MRPRVVMRASPMLRRSRWQASFSVRYSSSRPGALYLHLNWESIVSDGAFRTGGALSRAVSERAAAPLPVTSELYYFNGARLFAKGRYRDALDELSLVERDSVVAERARGLILRIEERLLRDVSELGTNEPNEAR